MIITDAVWEKRNIGVTTIEITISMEDGVDEIIDAVNSQNAEYLVVKAPSEYPAISFLLYKQGYMFVEEMNHIIHDLKLKPLTGYKKNIVENTNFELAERQDLDLIFQYIKKGMFVTDRIAQDPFFSKEISSQRYIYWIKDELSKGACVYKITKERNVYGFSGLKKVEQGFHEFIYGVFPEYQNKGISKAISYHAVNKVIQRGGTFLTTNISSSNMPSLKSRMSNGFAFDSSEYVFIKHEPPRIMISGGGG